MMIAIFFHAKGFYTLELPPGQDTPERIADYALLNPGTLRVESPDGEILWAPATN